jgi:hypothetical protein
VIEGSCGWEGVRLVAVPQWENVGLGGDVDICKNDLFAGQECVTDDGRRDTIAVDQRNTPESRKPEQINQSRAKISGEAIPLPVFRGVRYRETLNSREQRE